MQLNSEVTEATLFQKITYKISVTNSGAEVGEGIVVNSPAPVGTVVASAKTESGYFDQTLGKWRLDPLATNEIIELNLTVTIIEPNFQIVHFAWFDFSAKENLTAEFGTKGVSFDERVSIPITLKGETSDFDFSMVENSNFIKEKKEGIWKIYPLIADEKLSIETINRSKVGDFDLDFINEFGAVVFREKIFLKRGKGKTELSLGFIRPGKYTVKIQDKDGDTWQQEFWKK